MEKPGETGSREAASVKDPFCFLPDLM